MVNLFQKSFRFKAAIFPVFGSLATLLAGSILHDFIVILNAESTTAKGEEITTFPMGFILGVMVMFMSLFFTSFSIFSSRFDMVVSFGASRKEFFRNEIINQAIIILLAITALKIGGLMEALKCQILFPDYRNELDLSGLFSWKVMIPLGILLLGVIFFNGAVALRYAKWTSLFYIASCLVILLFATQISKFIKNMSVFIKNKELLCNLLIPGGMIVLGAVMLAGSWLLIRRQDVRV